MLILTDSKNSLGKTSEIRAGFRPSGLLGKQGEDSADRRAQAFLLLEELLSCEVIFQTGTVDTESLKAAYLTL